MKEEGNNVLFYFDCTEVIDYRTFLQRHKDKYFRMKIMLKLLLHISLKLPQM